MVVKSTKLGGTDVAVARIAVRIYTIFLHRCSNVDFAQYSTG
jgi:hypothetical protein